METPPLQRLHLEISSKCALACRLCSRTEYVDRVNAVDLSLEAIAGLVNVEDRFEYILLCGNNGDPIYHREFFEVLALLQKIAGAPAIVIATNGSGRSVEWWKKIGSILRPKDIVIFGIDGLEDTNHLYRAGAKWQSVMDGLKTLRASSACEIRWQWILFKQNEHQVKQGVALARELGVNSFVFVKSPRFKPIDPMRPTIEFRKAMEG